MLTIQIVGSSTFLAVTVLTPFIKEEFGLSSSVVGLLIAGMYLGYFFMLIPSGVLTDIFGERLMVAIGLGSLAIYSVVIGMSSRLWMLGLGLFAIGIGYSTIPPGTNKGVYDWFPPDQLGMGLGIKQTGVMIGGALSAALLPTLAMKTDWYLSFVAVGVMSLASLVLLFVYSSPKSTANEPSASNGNIKEVFQSQLGGTLKVFSEANLTPLLLVGFLFGAGQFTLMAYAVLYLTEEIALTVTSAGLLYTAMQLAGVISRVLFGYLADKRFRRNKQYLLLIIGVLGFFSYLALVGLPPTTPVAFVAVVATVLGGLTLGYNGVYLTMANELVGPEHTGFSTSVAVAAVMSGALVTPPVFGLLADRTGTFTLSMVLIAVLTLLAGVFSASISDEPKGAVEESH